MPDGDQNVEQPAVIPELTKSKSHNFFDPFEDIPAKQTHGKDAEIDLNDQLQNMQERLCFKLYKKKPKTKNKKYPEWKKDALRNEDHN